MSKDHPPVILSDKCQYIVQFIAERAEMILWQSDPRLASSEGEQASNVVQLCYSKTRGIRVKTNAKIRNGVWERKVNRVICACNTEF